MPSNLWEQRRRGKKVAQAFPVSRLCTNLFGPGAAQRMCSRLTLAVACAMTFRSRPATFCDPKSLLPAAKASDIEYADLDQSTPYSR
jgi:hypothetical protein